MLVSAAANRLRERLRMAGTDLEIPTKGLDAEGIAAHMGFWQSMGVGLGRPINAEARNDSYLPITRIGVDEIYHESGGANPLASGVIEKSPETGDNPGAAAIRTTRRGPDLRLSRVDAQCHRTCRDPVYMGGGDVLAQARLRAGGSAGRRTGNPPIAGGQS